MLRFMRLRTALLVLALTAATVVLTGCPASEFLRVPDVTGMDRDAAGAVIVNAGLMVGATTSVHNHAVPAGHVISQTPVAGATVPPRSTVDLVESLGPDPLPSEYNFGYADGFAEDDWYWDGFWDSYDTVDGQTLYYQGDLIPYVLTPPYDAGYWDGVWVAYHDGYFVAYHYAFIVGFSEGYDAAFHPDYLDFLEADDHVEYLHGGWADGYNDGFSEGRVFGAYDFEDGLPFDWRDALYDYEDGTDLYFQEVDVGTGIYGPVVLYAYGTDPFQLKRMDRRAAAERSIRAVDGLKSAQKDELFRPLSAEAAAELNQRPASPRTARELRLSDTWLERIESYLSGGAKSATQRAGF